MRSGKGTALLWLVVGGAAAGLITVAAVAWQAAHQQRRDGEAALRESARTFAQQALHTLPQRAEKFSLTEVTHPPTLDQFAIPFSKSWLEKPGAPEDWIFGPWPQPESAQSQALQEIQSLLSKNQKTEARAKYRSSQLVVILTAEQTTASGLPLGPLVSRLRLALAESDAERRTAAAQLLADAVLYPSSITDALVQEAIQALPSPAADEASKIQTAQRHASELNAFRQSARTHADALRRGDRWLERKWHLENLSPEQPAEGKVRSRDEVVEFARQNGLLQKNVSGLPSSLRFRPMLDGEILTDDPLPAETVLATATNAPWTLDVVHAADANPFATLDAQLLRQRWLIGGATIGLVAAAGGFLFAFLRQRQLNAMMTNFVAAVSHELRAPIGSMGLLAERMGHGKVESAEQHHHYHQLIRDECRRLAATIENVFAFSRIKRGKASFDPELTNMNALLRDAAELMQPRSEQRNILLVMALPDPDLECEVDPVALRQAVINLLENAIKFSPPASRILLSLEQQDGQAVVSVQDAGPGVSPAERARIFQPFYRTGSELHRETPGIGIGLAIVKHVAEQHEGSVKVLSPASGGCIFSISLPLRSPH